ncbi:uncharacterized protein LOC128984000 [Macrosteles quadrilineatus]|uniref:uncharacterized protein LOC128984000 n=1 Tax=Macrosteles quadrilineatus TaxID=74068 RepID=UPI0023E217B7|nr:uncharacterized protein LOC128984000 [Macrosteles quadrilineatus]
MNNNTGIESAVSQLPESQGDQFRCEASILLKKIPTPKPNLSKEETKAVSVLGKDGTVKILPADKGNATVVLDTVTYEEKMLETLQSGHYTQLKKDPTETFERKIASTLRKHKKFFSDKQRTRLTPHHSKIPHMYGLPKIHKPNVPLRPIVSSRDSACRELSKVLLDILKPLVGNTDSFIKNSKDFVEKSKSIVLADTDKLVSFDVEKGKLYRQDEGMAMGSPLSPIFANIFMEEFEQKALASARLKPRICTKKKDLMYLLKAGVIPEAFTHFVTEIPSSASARDIVLYVIEEEEGNKSLTEVTKKKEGRRSRRDVIGQETRKRSNVKRV